MPPRRRTATVRRTTTEEVTVTEEHDGDPVSPASYAPGWAALDPADPAWGGQRRDQVAQCLDLWRIWAASTPPGEKPPESLRRETVTVLRAGPDATLMERTLGRS